MELQSLTNQLGLSWDKGQKDDGNPTAFDVLQHLLSKGLVTDSDIRLAVNDIRVEHTSKKDVPVETSSVNPMNVISESEKLQNGNQEEDSAKPAAVVRTRHIALRFYYDGGNYSGLAQNMGMKDDKSIEKALFEALVKTKLVESRETSGFSRCGRTDKGVSAAGQVVAIHLKSAFPLDASYDEDGSTPVLTSDLPKNSSDSLSVWVPPKKGGPNRQNKLVTEYPYDRMLNNTLPPDIRILGWCPVSDDFSARFSATTRTYRYFFVARDMDLIKMEQGLQLLVGQHDFRNFCKMDVEKVYNFERKIHSAQLKRVDEDDELSAVWYLQIMGQAFLWHQIRCIASILFLVGRGFEPVSVVKELLDVERHPGKPSYPLAPERPLVLHDCGYPNLQVGHSTNNLWNVSCQLEQQWEELALAAARVRNCIASLDTAQVTRKDAVTFALAKLRERRKKRQRMESNPLSELNEERVKMGPPGKNDLLSWSAVVDWLRLWGCVPEPDGIRETMHVPLLDRAKGTTYDEKVDALQKSVKRRQKYEENVIKKRKSAEEDAAFYEHMTKQGGSGI